MQKVAHARKIKRHTVFVRRLYHLVVSNATAGLDHAFYAHFCGDIDAISKRKKRLASKRAAVQVEIKFLRLSYRGASGVHALRPSGIAPVYLP